MKTIKTDFGVGITAIAGYDYSVPQLLDARSFAEKREEMDLVTDDPDYRFATNKLASGLLVYCAEDHHLYMFEGFDDEDRRVWTQVNISSEELADIINQTVEGDLTAINQKIESLTNNVDSLTNNVDSLTNNVNSLTNNVDSLTNNFNSLSENVTVQLTNLSTEINDIRTFADQTFVSALANYLSSYLTDNKYVTENYLTSNYYDINDINNTVSTINNEITDIKTEIVNINKTINNLSTKIENLNESYFTELITNIINDLDGFSDDLRWEYLLPIVPKTAKYDTIEASTIAVRSRELDATQELTIASAEYDNINYAVYKKADIDRAVNIYYFTPRSSNVRGYGFSLSSDYRADHNYRVTFGCFASFQCQIYSMQIALGLRLDSSDGSYTQEQWGSYEMFDDKESVENYNINYAANSDDNLGFTNVMQLTGAELNRFKGAAMLVPYVKIEDHDTVYSHQKEYQTFFYVNNLNLIAATLKIEDITVGEVTYPQRMLYENGFIIEHSKTQRVGINTSATDGILQEWRKGDTIARMCSTGFRQTFDGTHFFGMGVLLYGVLPVNGDQTPNTYFYWPYTNRDDVKATGATMRRVDRYFYSQYFDPAKITLGTPFGLADGAHGFIINMPVKINNNDIVLCSFMPFDDDCYNSQWPYTIDGDGGTAGGHRYINYDVRGADKQLCFFGADDHSTNPLRGVINFVVYRPILTN